ncbi:hypothetical protein OUZ56_008408 [Daphnia magna]|uniref:Uncharacterized protein n=1 Tax=Daphnia magna TaxID=35525 RepID=A0ABR0ACV6_9CRUS|nr:hypothetical protein OUZ56_008408 [Daphnia magna]
MDLLQAQHLLVRDACEAFDSREGFARFRLPAHAPAEMAADLFRRQSSSNEPDRDQNYVIAEKAKGHSQSMVCHLTAYSG